jgi:sulfate adenylyltransferase
MHKTIIPKTLLIEKNQADNWRNTSLNLTSLTLNRRQLCDLELLLNGSFSPLNGFMDETTYLSVINQARLPDGNLWPIPITLDVSANFAEKLTIGSHLALRDPEGFMPAVMRIDCIWQPDKIQEAELVYGTKNPLHPGVRHLLEEMGQIYIGGVVEGLQLPAHYDFENLWNTPEELRHLFNKMGWRRVMSFHSTNLMHRLHRDLVLDVAKAHQANILLHPAVGVTKPGDLHYYARVRCYKAVQRQIPHDMAILSLLPLAMRMAGPREALWHAIVNSNYGCTHFIVGPDHASPPHEDKKSNEIFYGKYQAQEYALNFAKELDIQLIPVAERHYVPKRGRFMPVPDIQEQQLKDVTISDSKLKDLLIQNQEIPDWLTYSEVLDALRLVFPPRNQQGFTLFFTGLSGSGKSTLANIVFAKLIEHGSRPVSLLDGDIVRQNLSSELGFSKHHRDINIRRIGFVASEITKNKGVAVCAPIAPYTETRRAVRSSIEQHGAFIEIYVATPLEVCESRDRKGLYAKARKGLIPEFTGISDPYQVPEHPELQIDTTDLQPAEAAQEIMLYLFKQGFLD